MLAAQSAVPHAALRPFIRGYVLRETPSNAGEIVEAVVPRAETMLEFQFASAYEVREYGTEALRSSWTTTIIGPIDARRVRLILRGRIHALVVLFRPLGFHRLFGLPMWTLTGAGTEGHAALGPQISWLYERLGNTSSFADRAKILDSFLMHRLLQSQPLNQAALAMRLLTSGHSRVQHIAEKIGVSERQLERRSLELTGISPKSLFSISRFQRAIAKHQSGFGNWMEIACEVGYYDQMHLIRDFHQLAGGSPTEVMREIADHHLISYCCR